MCMDTDRNCSKAAVGYTRKSHKPGCAAALRLSTVRPKPAIHRLRHIFFSTMLLENCKTTRIKRRKLNR